MYISTETKQNYCLPQKMHSENFEEVSENHLIREIFNKKKEKNIHKSSRCQKC